MANTLTNLLPDLYTRLDVVSRELVGLIPSVTMDASSARASLNQTVRSPVAPAATSTTITAAAALPDAGDQVIGNKTISISKSKRVDIRWAGEEQVGMNTSSGYNPLLLNQFEQAFRTLTNEVESDIAALYVQASRAVGAAATVPFSTAGDFSAAADVEKILADNGAPGERSLILNTTHAAKLLGLQSRADIVGNSNFLQQGVYSQLAGMNLRRSGQLGADHTAGTGSGATTNSAGYAIGAVTITLASAGTGTILAGDVITFAGDTNKYVVLTGDADVSNGGTVVLNAPGLRQAIAASPVAITVTAATDHSIALSRDAIAIVTRVPASPVEGDLALDASTVVDPRSGITFEVRQYGGYRTVRYEVALAWGVAVIKPEHMGLIIG